MYKFLLLYLFGMAMAFAGCKKETKNIFDKTVDERLAEALNSYQQKLTQTPGWKVFVFPHGLQSQDINVGGFTYFMKFTNANRVTMVSDFDSAMSVPKESGYRLKAVQRPSIYFDTYSYIHVAADPTQIVNNSPSFENGNGWGTDFDFAFADSTQAQSIGDTINLKGNFNNSEAVMIRATQAEIDSAFNKGRLNTIKNNTAKYLQANTYLYFLGGGNSLIVFSFDQYRRIIEFFYFSPSGNLISIETVPYTYTITGIRFKNPISVGGYTFQELLWDNTRQIYYIQTGGRRVDFVSSPSPILSFSLTTLIGVDYTVISIPPQPLPNQSPTFTAKYNAVKAALKASSFNLDLTFAQFVFNATNKTMRLNLYAYPGTNLFTAQYTYTYTVDNSGYFKFTRTGQNEYGRQIESIMRGILDYIETDNFRLTGTMTTTSVLGQFTSKERPDFYFSGNLL